MDRTPLPLRAIARERWPAVIAPGLYRYFGSPEDLARNMVGDIFTEVAEDIGLAIRTAVLQTGSETEPGTAVT